MIKNLKQIFVLFFLFSIKISNAQLTGPIALDEKVTYEQPSKEKLKEGALVMIEKRFLDYSYDEAGDAEMSRSYYFKIFVSTKEAIEDYNKIYFGNGKVLALTTLKVRVIKKDGTVVTTDKSQVKEVTNDNGRKLQELAVEGLEENSILEYCYSYKTNPFYYGQEYFQTGTPKQEVFFRLTCPKNLFFNCNSYNGLPKFKSDTVNSSNIMTMTAKDIPALKKQEYSFSDKYKHRIEYVLAENKVNGRRNFYAYNEFAINTIKNMRTLERAEEKAISKLIKQLNISDKNIETVKVLERNLKLTIQTDDKSENPELNQLDKILKNKVGTSNAITKIYLAALSALEIKNEIVVVSDRSEPQIDKSFETYSHLDEFLIYLPDFNAYLSPKNFSSRIGFPPPEFQGCDALFLKEIKIGENISAVAKVKTTDVLPLNKSENNIETFVTLNVDSGITEINKTLSLSGYPAFYVQPIYAFLDDNAKKEMQKAYLFEEADAQKRKFTSTVSNYEPTDVFEKPIILKANYSTADLIENAGNKILFKAGLLIGKQVEMYQERERTLPAEVQYLHSFNRKLTIKIPKGFKIANASDININANCQLEGKTLASFKSDFVIDENNLVINCRETYEALIYPIEVFETYKKVVNAAADFNKIVLVFEEK